RVVLVRHERPIIATDGCSSRSGRAPCGGDLPPPTGANTLPPHAEPWGLGTGPVASPCADDGRAGTAAPATGQMGLARRGGRGGDVSGSLPHGAGRRARRGLAAGLPGASAPRRLASPRFRDLLRAGKHRAAG